MRGFVVEVGIRQEIIKRVFWKRYLTRAIPHHLCPPP